jgi:argininosuccinate lyase
MTTVEPTSVPSSPAQSHDRSTYGVGTRLKRPPSDELKSFFQRAYLSTFDDIAFDAVASINLAHTMMLGEVGVISLDEARQILKTVRDWRNAGREAFPLEPGRGDILPNTEIYVLEQLGDFVGGKMHTGRSRGDFYVTLSRLKFRPRTVDLMDAALEFRQALLDVALEHVQTLMPGHSHLQHAQPVTLAHHLLGFVHMLERDFGRLREAWNRLNVNPLGLGILATSPYPLNRERTAELLGFDGLIRNGRDLIDRDYSAELAADAAILMMHLNKLATDLYLWSTQEFGVAQVPDEDAMTSSIMPQKANPVILEQILAEAGRVQGELAGVLATLKGTSANNVEAASADGAAIRAVEGATWSLRELGPALRRLEFDRELLARRAGEHWAQATDLADALVRDCGLSFRQAHHVVGRLVGDCLAEGLRPVDVNVERFVHAAEQTLGRPVMLSEAALQAALDPWHSIQVRTLLGGPSPEAMRPLLEDAARHIAADQADLAALQYRIEAAREQLESAVEDMLET